MTVSGDHSGRQTTREAAALWFARMRGPDAGAHRPAFDAWLASDPAHLRAYNNVVETFQLGKMLRSKPARSRTRVTAWALAAAALCPLFLVAFCLHEQTSHRADEAQIPTVPAAGQTGMSYRQDFQSPIGAIRQFELPDGSRLTLDTASLVSVAYQTDRRSLTLIRGRARFEVAHQPRPFIVTAGTTTITAHGTLFDVRLTSIMTDVHLLRGIIDVRPTANQASNDAARPRLMQTGDHLLFGGDAWVKTAASGDRDDQWPAGVIEVYAVPLGHLVAEANRYSRKPILLSDTALGKRRVSGTFHLRETSQLAENLGALLGLAVVEHDRDIVMGPSDGTFFSSGEAPPS